MSDTEISEALSIFAANCKRTRNAQGLTLKDIQERTRLTNTYINKVENGRANISLNNCDKIAKALQTPLHVLLLPPF
ncbi:helix-turn-helix domain-containing protein [Pelagibius sp. Alg239-R121]|uniref:helix-turn-helix domain-containing protein n=1 Tax=Pelagibius sp. Alg239-R121 TaxID=2993448 RepID=UPI003460B162